MSQIFIKSLYAIPAFYSFLMPGGLLLSPVFSPMIGIFTKRINKREQYLISLLLVLAVSGICYGIATFLGYRVVAFILLLTVSLIAISFDILPVLLSAILSAFIWNYFFIPPRFTFHVSTTDDVILFIMYFVIALINAALTYKIRQVEKASRKKEEKANTLKLYDTLLHSLSHELRTPISTIIAATDNLQSSNDNITKENKDQMVSEISKASFRLNQQVENLLNMSRLESGFIQPKKDWCDMNELIYSTVKKIEQNKIHQKITININPDMPLVKTDKMMLEQIVYNLLNNACLYTKDDSKINIIAINHADVLQVTIEDNGEGFPEEEIGNVFDKFYRLKNAKAGGTGLGLSIVKGFAEALKGNVSLKNVSTGGSKFTIEIPCELSHLKA
jgi:two-component system sensor histidine kinase KdpD